MLTRGSAIGKFSLPPEPEITKPTASVLAEVVLDGLGAGEARQ
jgi:hypothetical protein